MPKEKCYRYGNWTRNTQLRITDEPHDTPGPWYLPWQRTREEIVSGPANWGAGAAHFLVAPPEIEYATDEEVARDKLRERFGPK
jgi:hypothetical protein